MKTTRWEQRLEHFKKSTEFLREALKKKNFDAVSNAGIIKAYEMSFELAWKVLKDFLEFKGFVNVSGPRDVLKEAFAHAYISDGHEWLKMLEDRNLLAHTYDPGRAQEAVKHIASDNLKKLTELEAFLSGQVA